MATLERLLERQLSRLGAWPGDQKYMRHRSQHSFDIGLAGPRFGCI